MESSTAWGNSRILVTGGSGFLGTHLCRRLCEQGIEVHATSRVERTEADSGIHWWQCDWSDLAAIRNLFREVKPEVVYHLAGVVSADPSSEFVLPTFHSLLVSTVNLLTVATELGCRRILLAGSLRDPQHSGPNWEPVPMSPYEAAKWAGSGYGRMFHTLYGVPVVILRPFMTYGPGQDSNKLIPSVIRSVLRGETPRLSSGRWEADWVYVDDVIEGFIRGGYVPNIEGSTIDLGTGLLTSVRTVVEDLVKIMGASVDPVFGALSDRPMEPTRVANLKVAEASLGWTPAISLPEGLRRTAHWYAEGFKSNHSISPSC